MQSTKDVGFNESVVLRSKDLEMLLAALQLRDDDLEFSVECRDGTVMTPTCLAEIVSLPNPDHRAIKRIKASTKWYLPKPGAPRISLNFDSDGYPAFRYELGGEDAEVILLSTVIQDHVRPMMQTISVPAYLPFVLAPVLAVVGFIAITLGVSPFIVHAMGRKIIFGSHEFSRGWGALVLLTAALLVMIAASATKLASYFFPQVAFLIGAGERRYENMLSLRRQLGWTVIVGCAVSILAGILLSFISK